MSKSMNTVTVTSRGALALLLLVLTLVACDDGSSRPDGLPAGPGGPAGAAQGEAAPVLHANIEAARAALRDGDLEKSRQLLSAILPTDPSYLVALRELGTVYANLGDHETALKVLDRLATLEPDSPEVWIDLSWAQFQVGDSPAAELSTLRALELSPDSLAARYNVGFFRLAQGRLPEASRAYHRAMKRDFAMEYIARARDHLLRLQQDRPDFPDVHFILASMANALGNREEEIEELQRYLDMNPVGPAVPVARDRLKEAQEKSAP